MLQNKKENKAYILGIDVGNFNTKSEHTILPSGFNVSSSKPMMAEEYLLYDGTYYVPREDRFNYVVDKTNNDKHFMLALMSMAKEIYERAKVVVGSRPEAIQEQINRYSLINLGIGVPPAHHNALAAKYVSYFKERFGDEIQFEYCIDGHKYEFDFSVPVVRVFPQDYSVVVEYADKSEILKKKFNRFYAIDIGGKTVDFVVIANGKPDKYRSFENGILTMYDEIKNRVLSDYTIRLENSNCEDILMDKPTVVKENIITLVKDMANDWTSDILSKLRAEGLDFETNPTIFIGGGAKLLKPFIESSNIVTNYEFVGDVNANAVSYAKLLRGIQ